MNCVKALTPTPVFKLNFTYQERLRRKKSIEKLFARGQILHLHPVRFVYLANTNSDALPQVLFAVPKKKIRSAVARNVIKRRMRESYRIHKHILTGNYLRKVQWLVGCIYIGTIKEGKYQMIEKRMTDMLHHLKETQD